MIFLCIHISWDLPEQFCSLNCVLEIFDSYLLSQCSCSNPPNLTYSLFLLPYFWHHHTLYDFCHLCHFLTSLLAFLPYLFTFFCYQEKMSSLTTKVRTGGYHCYLGLGLPEATSSLNSNTKQYSDPILINKVEFKNKVQLAAYCL